MAVSLGSLLAGAGDIGKAMYEQQNTMRQYERDKIALD